MEIIELEEWRDIPDAPGYQVSSYGRVRSPRRFLKRSFTRSGLVKVAIIKDGRPASPFVSALVASAFIKDRPPNHWIHYLDYDPSNCRADNLDYRTSRFKARREVSPKPIKARREVSPKPILQPSDDRPESTRPTIQPRQFSGSKKDFRPYWSATPEIMDIRMSGSIAILTDREGNRFEIRPGDWFAARAGRIIIVQRKETRPDKPDGLPEE